MKRKIYLSIHDGHDANISVSIDGKIVLAVAKERVSRIKMDSGYPKALIEKAFKKLNISWKDIDEIVFTNKYHIIYRLFWKNRKYVHEYLTRKQNLYLYIHHLIYSSKFIRSFLSILLRSYFTKISKAIPFKVYDHHRCHAASAFFTSTFQNAMVVSIDAVGDGLSGAVYSGKNNKISLIKRFSAIHSLGEFYGEITEILGFNPMRHGGKVTGLAAYGDASKTDALMKKLIFFNNGELNFLPFGKRKNIYAKLLNLFQPEDIAAGAQKRLEDVVIDLLTYYYNNYFNEKINIALAGGIFGNVKLNQKINELDFTQHIFIHPAMGDAGLSSGALLFHLALNNELEKKYIDNIYLGFDYSEKSIKNSLSRYNHQINYKTIDSVKEIALLLAEGKVIALFNGRMEYGPRALGNRSIIYAPGDPSVNDWLNKKLMRTEFMPFAPTTLHEFRDRFYRNINGAEYASKYMTVTFECTDEMNQLSPALVHVDNTARPQLLKKEDNEFYYNIIKEYYKITGNPTVLNTSFNLHEEPIVCSPDDAIRGYLKAGLDYLVLENFLISKKQVFI